MIFGAFMVVMVNLKKWVSVGLFPPVSVLTVVIVIIPFQFNTKSAFSSIINFFFKKSLSVTLQLPISSVKSRWVVQILKELMMKTDDKISIRSCSVKYCLLVLFFFFLSFSKTILLFHKNWFLLHLSVELFFLESYLMR